MDVPETDVPKTEESQDADMHVPETEGVFFKSIMSDLSDCVLTDCFSFFCS